MPLAFTCTVCAWYGLWLTSSNGDPVPHEGSLTDSKITPDLKDIEYYQLALDIVGKNGWSADDISLSTIGRTLICGSKDDTLQIWITLFRWRRVGLTWISDTGFVKLFPYLHEATFYLSGSESFVSYLLFREAGLDLDELQVDSGDAINLANKEVKGMLPTSWGGECEIGVSNDNESKQPTWEVNYGSTTSDEVIRVKVDAISGEVSQEESPLSK